MAKSKRPTKSSRKDGDEPKTTSSPADGDSAALEQWLAPSTSSSIDHVDVAQIDAGWEPDRVGQAPLEATVAAIAAVGVVEPVLLRPRDGGRYEVVTGHRTVAAARLAGIGRVPAVVKELDDAGALMALVFDGSASGQVTAGGASELRRRLLEAGAHAEDVEDVMLAVPVAAEAQPALVGEAVAAPQEVLAEQEEISIGAEPEPALVGAASLGAESTTELFAPSRGLQPEGADTASQGRWLPLPAGRPRLARLSSAFADAPRMLGILAGDRFTGTVELVGRDGRKDAIAYLDGRILATYVEQGERRVDAPLRLPTPDRGPTVEITVRPHPRAVSVALALALRSPTRFTGLHAAFLHLPGLLDLLRTERADAACIVSSPTGSGVILLDAGQPVAAYARRWGDEPSEDSETTDVSAVLDMLVSGDGEVDVHTGDVPEPLDLDDVVARSVPGD